MKKRAKVSWWKTEIIYDTLLQLQQWIKERNVEELGNEGICFHVVSKAPKNLQESTYDCLVDYFKRWSLFVTELAPIPPGRGVMLTNESITCKEDLAKQVYNESDEYEMWLDGEYAELRQELIQFIIDEIETEMKG